MYWTGEYLFLKAQWTLRVLYQISQWYAVMRYLKERQHVEEFRAGKITEETLLRSFDSYLGVLSHADSHELKQELRHKFWEWIKEPESAKTKRDSRPAAHID